MLHWKVHDCNSPSPITQLKAGIRIAHRFAVDGQLTTFTGAIISQVIGFPEWFNAVYDKEPDLVYTFRLTEDLNNGDLEVLSSQ